MTRRIVVCTLAFLAAATLAAKALPETTAFPEFMEEQPPADAPAGTRTFTTVFNGFVYSGTVSRFTMKGKAFSLGGSDIVVRKAAFFGEPSHFLVPPSIPMPSGVKKRIVGLKSL